MSQFRYFIQDVKRMLGKHSIRILHIWMSRAFLGVLFYRMERSGYLLLGSYYSYIRIIFIPLLQLIQAFSNVDIHYKANIGGGILILHPSVGCVISGHSVIGTNLTLTGGNVIGFQKKRENKEFIIGTNCSLGANATIIGPLCLGNNVTVGASACVVHSFEADGIVLTGVPANTIKSK